jgi:hypothetical protein
MTIVPYPPMPEFSGSTTLRAAATATAASNALPPARRISIPACEASSWALLTIPRVPVTGARSTWPAEERDCCGDEAAAR